MNRVDTSSRVISRPSWWKLYASVLVGLALAAILEMQVPAGTGRTAVQIIAALILFETMAIWVRAKRVGLELGNDVATIGAAPRWRPRVTHGQCLMPTIRATAFGQCLRISRDIEECPRNLEAFLLPI